MTIAEFSAWLLTASIIGAWPVGPVRCVSTACRGLARRVTGTALTLAFATLMIVVSVSIVVDQRGNGTTACHGPIGEPCCRDAYPVRSAYLLWRAALPRRSIPDEAASIFANSLGLANRPMVHDVELVLNGSYMLAMARQTFARLCNFACSQP